MDKIPHYCRAEKGGNLRTINEGDWKYLSDEYIQRTILKSIDTMDAVNRIQNDYKESIGGGFSNIFFTNDLIKLIWEQLKPMENLLGGNPFAIQSEGSIYPPF